jgi:hypothetical protein
MGCGIHCPRAKLYAEIAEKDRRVRRVRHEAGYREAGKDTNSEIKKLAAKS